MTEKFRSFNRRLARGRPAYWRRLEGYVREHMQPQIAYHRQEPPTIVWSIAIKNLTKLVINPWKIVLMSSTNIQHSDIMPEHSKHSKNMEPYIWICAQIFIPPTRPAHFKTVSGWQWSRNSKWSYKHKSHVMCSLSMYTIVKHYYFEFLMILIK